MAEETIFIQNATSDTPIQQIQQLLKGKDGIERVLIDTDDGEMKIEFDEKKISLRSIYSLLKENNFDIQR
jgi:hypothetical protein